jgi:hypothetical protein
MAINQLSVCQLVHTQVSSMSSPRPNLRYIGRPRATHSPQKTINEKDGEEAVNPMSLRVIFGEDLNLTTENT